VPQKTIYLSEADAALWDTVKGRIGEKSMSTLFAEYLRQTLDTQEGFLHIVRGQRGGTLRQVSFAVMFAPLDAPGGFMQPQYCQGLAELEVFLRKLGLAERVVDNIITGLKTQESISQRLTLTSDKAALF
jgi:hypothetical protein